MDGFLLVIWVVRLLFLALLYLFLARVVRALLRDLRAAAREPGASLGRLIVVESPGGEPEAGRSFDLDAITTLGRDVNNAIVDRRPVRLGRARRPDLSRPELVRRGPRAARTARSSTAGRSTRSSPLGFGDEVQIGQVRLRLERARDRVTGASRPAATRRRAARAILGADPAAPALDRGDACWPSSRSRSSSAASRSSARRRPARFAPYDAAGLGIYLGALGAGPRRPGAGRSPDGPGPAAGRRPARRHLACC